MAPNRSKSIFASKSVQLWEVGTTKECCSIGNLNDQIIIPVPDSSVHCAVCGTPVRWSHNSELSNDNTNVVNAPREPSVVDQDPGVNISQDPPQIDHNCCYECGDSLNGIFCQQCICESCGKGAHFGYNCPPKDPIISELEPCYNRNFDCFPHDSQTLPQQYFCCENCGGPHETYQCQPMNQEYFYSHSSGFDQFQPPQFSDVYQTPPISKFRGEEIDEEYERDCEIRIRKLKQDFNIWGSEVRKKEKAYEDEKYSAACRYMLSITCDDEDDYIPSGDIIARYSTSITPDLPIEESENSLIMGDEPLSTIPATESDEVIKSSVENLVPIPSEFEGISDDTSDVPTCDNNCVNVESDLLESLINRDTSIVYSSKIDPILEEFADELAHIAPIPPGIVEADFDPNDDDYDDNFYDCVDIEEDGGEIDFDISKIVDISLREKLVESYLLIEKINTFNLSPPIPISPIICPSSTIPVVDIDLSLEEADETSFSDNSILRGIESDRDSGEDTTSIDDLPLDDSMIFPEYESFTFDDEPVMAEVNVFDEINTSELSYPGIGENDVLDEEEDSFTFTTRTFLPFVTYPEVLPTSYSTGSEDKVFKPGIFDNVLKRKSSRVQKS
ncbi:hypothetical protein Tco_0939150 [Tanacetum coccineum]|uniref:CCHC-type domain-containing protein n=1 Tax=Tanacetum coccineum TaxID=301880 RepID=A0ABQ5DJ98_9ASTR